MYSCGPPHMDVQEWNDQHELTYSSYVRTRDVTLKICRKRWMIGRNGERRSGISAQAARHDDDDDDIYICRCRLLTLNGSSLKLIDKFIYIGSSVSSTETDINTRQANAWTANDNLSVIWTSDLTDKIKRSFFKAAVILILLYGFTTWTLTKRMEKKSWQKLRKNAASNTERVLEAATNKAASVRPPNTHHENYQS